MIEGDSPAHDSTITVAERADCGFVQALVDRLLGAGYLDADRAFAEPAGAMFRIAWHDGRRAGFVIARFIDRAALAEMQGGQSFPPAYDRAASNGRLGEIKTIAVGPEKQGCGIGKALIADAESKLRQAGATAVIVPAWSVCEDIPIAGLMQATGYQPLSTIPAFWRDDCQAGRFRCPSRVGARCVCSLTVYGKSGLR